MMWRMVSLPAWPMHPYLPLTPSTSVKGSWAHAHAWFVRRCVLWLLRVHAACSYAVCLVCTLLSKVAYCAVSTEFVDDTGPHSVWAGRQVVSMRFCSPGMPDMTGLSVTILLTVLISGSEWCSWVAARGRGQKPSAWGYLCGTCARLQVAVGSSLLRSAGLRDGRQMLGLRHGFGQGGVAY